MWAKFKGYISLSHSKFDHKNIVRCLGITSDPRGELLLILELMEGGDLRKYLRSHRQKEVCLLMNPKSIDIFTGADVFIPVQSLLLFPYLLRIRGSVKWYSIGLLRFWGHPQVNYKATMRLKWSSLHVEFLENIITTYLYLCIYYVLKDFCLWS